MCFTHLFAQIQENCRSLSFFTPATFSIRFKPVTNCQLIYNINNIILRDNIRPTGARIIGKCSPVSPRKLFTSRPQIKSWTYTNKRNPFSRNMPSNIPYQFRDLMPEAKTGETHFLFHTLSSVTFVCFPLVYSFPFLQKTGKHYRLVSSTWYFYSYWKEI